MGTGDDEEDLLSVVDSNVEGLLVVLHKRGQWWLLGVVMMVGA